MQGTLDLMILKVVSAQPLHGYGISKRLRAVSNEALRVQQGSLYPALHRLELKGWLSSEWRNSESGRTAKYYALTPAGRRQLQIEVSEWEKVSRVVGLVLRST